MNLGNILSNILDEHHKTGEEHYIIYGKQPIFIDKHLKK